MERTRLDTPWLPLVVGVQVWRSPLVIWWFGTRQGGLAEALEELQDVQGRLVSTSKVASVGAFALDLAHQLRNPLFIITGRLESLQEEAVTPSMAHHVDVALASAQRVQQLIRDFVDLGRRRSTLVDVVPLLEDALESVLLRYEQAPEVERDFHEPLPRLSGNATLLKEVFANLLSNAAEATPVDGTITISAAALDGTIEIAIADTGAGIPPDRQGQLFQPFHSSRDGGMGLGLFSAKHITELHHGTIAIDSAPDAGTRVTVSFPVTGPAVEGHTDSRVPAGSQSAGDQGS